MTERRDQLIGIRFTKKERQIIENFAERRNLSLTSFIRESIFSHINNLTNNVGNLDIDDYRINFDKIENSTEIILKCIKYLKKRLNAYNFSKSHFYLTKEKQKSKNVDNIGIS